MKKHFYALTSGCKEDYGIISIVDSRKRAEKLQEIYNFGKPKYADKVQIEEYIDDDQSGLTVFLTDNGEVSGFAIGNAWNTEPYVLNKKQKYNGNSIYVMTEDIKEASNVAKTAWTIHNDEQQWRRYNGYC